MCFYGVNLSQDQLITICTTLVGLFGSVAVAYWIFNSEQNERKKQEDELNDDHYNFFDKILEKYLSSIDKQVKHLNEYLNEESFHLTLKSVVDLPHKLLDKLDIIRLEKVVLKKNKNNDDFKALLIRLNYANDIIARIDSEFFRYFDRLRELEDIYKKNQMDLIGYHNYELLNLLKDPVFSKNFYAEVVQYQKLITIASKDKTIFPDDGVNPINKEKLFTEVFKPSMDLIGPLRHRDMVFLVIAMKLNTIANTRNDLKILKESHRQTIISYKNILNLIASEIKRF